MKKSQLYHLIKDLTSRVTNLEETLAAVMDDIHQPHSNPIKPLTPESDSQEIQRIQSAVQNMQIYTGQITGQINDDILDPPPNP